MLMSSCLILVPHVSAQTSEVKILSYSYYIDNLGILDVVGEVQNVGPNVLTSTTLTGSVFSGGVDQADASCFVGLEQYAVEYLAPNQKAPFYMEFYSPSNSADSNANWYSIGAVSIVLTVSQANWTSSYQYPDLKVTSQSSSIGTNP